MLLTNSLRSVVSKSKATTVTTPFGGGTLLKLARGTASGIASVSANESRATPVCKIIQLFKNNYCLKSLQDNNKCVLV